MKIIKLNDSKPYTVFRNYYESAIKNNQTSHDAISISSFNSLSNEVESRFVNLKYIDGEKWTFFSNYNSNKADNFKEHNQISALIYWNSINVQIRMKALIYKTSSKFSDKHFSTRTLEKNALAISSDQSKIINSYDDVVKNYRTTLNKKDLLMQRPIFWGGYSFIPYYFEFWEGNDSRLNKREVFIQQDDLWINQILQP